MSLKNVQRLDEGPFDFIRGAAGEMKRKVANSAPVRAGREIVQAGRNASAAAELEKEIMALARLVAPQKPGRVDPSMDEPKQATAPKAPQPAPRPNQTTQQRQPAAQNTQQPSPFRTTTKPKGKIGPLGKDDFRWTFDSYLRATYGEPLNEGAMDFLRGASSAAVGKFNDFVQKYGEQPSVLKDLYNAGRNASQRADAAKQEKAAAAAAQQKQQQVAQIVASIKQRTQQMGANGAQAVKAIVAKLPSHVRQPVMQALGA